MTVVDVCAFSLGMTGQTQDYAPCMADRKKKKKKNPNEILSLPRTHCAKGPKEEESQLELGETLGHYPLLFFPRIRVDGNVAVFL
jgi:hypothetical protein